MDLPKFLTIVGFAKVMGLSAPFWTKPWIRPGWATSARSGGLPPSTAVESTVGRLSPALVYFTFTPGYFFRKPSITAWKEACSLPVQMPMIEMEPLTAVLVPVALLPVLVQPAASTAGTAAASASIAARRLI